jgi:hypothetical protein
MRAVVLAMVLAALGVLDTPAFAQEFNLVIRNHKFEPEEIRVPAGKRVSIYVSNEDATPEEFDSTALKVEKIIPGKSKGLVRIGPLDPGVTSSWRVPRGHCQRRRGRGIAKCWAPSSSSFAKCSKPG